MSCKLCGCAVRFASTFTPEQLRAEKFALTVPYVAMNQVPVCIICAREITCAFAEAGRVRT